jgi:hypothetical protein
MKPLSTFIVESANTELFGFIDTQPHRNDQEIRNAIDAYSFKTERIYYDDSRKTDLLNTYKKLKGYQ